MYDAHILYRPTSSWIQLSDQVCKFNKPNTTLQWRGRKKIFALRLTMSCFTFNNKFFGVFTFCQNNQKWSNLVFILKLSCKVLLMRMSIECLVFFPICTRWCVQETSSSCHAITHEVIQSSNLSMNNKLSSASMKLKKMDATKKMCG